MISDKMVVDNYRIKDNYDNSMMYSKIEKPSLEIEKKEDNPFQMYDDFCSSMNSIKYKLLEKTSLAEMGRVVEATRDKPIIGTLALDTCYGILFYDRARKEGICGHAVPGSLTNVMAEMMKWLDGRVGLVEYMILPGYRNVDYKNYSGLNELVDYMTKNKPEGINLNMLKVGTSGYRVHQSTLSYEFAFDTSRGKFVTEYVFFNSIEHNSRYISDNHRFGK